MEDKFNKEVRVLREDGSYTWTHVNLIVKTYAPERNSIELICINYDITRLKATEAMLIDAKEKAEESDRLKSAFLANMSHENTYTAECYYRLFQPPAPYRRC